MSFLSRSQVLICRNYMGDMDMNEIDHFMPILNKREEDAEVSPLVCHGSAHFLFIKHSNLYCILLSSCLSGVTWKPLLWPDWSLYSFYNVQPYVKILQPLIGVVEMKVLLYLYPLFYKCKLYAIPLSPSVSAAGNSRASLLSHHASAAVKKFKTDSLWCDMHGVIFFLLWEMGLFNFLTHY